MPDVGRDLFLKAGGGEGLSMFIVAFHLSDISIKSFFFLPSFWERGGKVSESCSKNKK